MDFAEAKERAFKAFETQRNLFLDSTSAANKKFDDAAKLLIQIAVLAFTISGVVISQGGGSGSLLTGCVSLFISLACGLASIWEDHKFWLKIRSQQEKIYLAWLRASESSSEQELEVKWADATKLERDQGTYSDDDYTVKSLLFAQAVFVFFGILMIMLNLMEFVLLT